LTRLIARENFIILQFSPWSVFFPFRSKYLPQHFVLKNPQYMFLPQNERPGFALVQHNWRIRVLYLLIFSFFILDGKPKKDFVLKW
jgi:hypothetical protein